MKMSLYRACHNFVTAESMSYLYLDTKSLESSQGRMLDALAHGGDEGRDKLR